MPIFTGTTADETLTGTDEADVIDGGGGFDVIAGRGGDDRITGLGILSGGEGDDRIVLTQPVPNGQPSSVSGGNGFDTLDLTMVRLGSPSLSLGSVKATIRADGEALIGEFGTYDSRGNPAGVQSIFRADGIERLLAYVTPNFDYPVPTGTVGVNIDLTGRTTPIELIGGQLGDFFRGGSGADILHGGGNRDLLILGAGDQGFGDDGDDTLQFFTNDYLGLSANGGAGVDSLTISMVGTFEGLTLVPGADPRISLTGIENVTLVQELAYNAPTLVTSILGDAGDNVISFIRAANATPVTTGITLRGGAGNDTIRSAGTNDFLYGDEGDDVITGNGRLDGGAGNDRLSGSGDFFGGGGSDVLGAQIQRSGNSSNYAVVDGRFEGGDGVDTFQFVPFQFSDVHRYVISLAAGTATGSSTTSGVTFSGVITLAGVENVIGGSGDDTITGDDGGNRLEGGEGADVIFGGGGNDLIFGQTGTLPTLSEGNDRLYGEAGDDTIYGNSGADLLDGGSGNDWLNGNLGDDTLLGGDGSDRLIGEEGADRLEGGAGADVLDGGDGADVLMGGAGDDWLIGGAGIDVHDGGEGLDTAVFAFSAEVAAFTYQNGQIIVTGPEGREILTGVERFQFSNAEFEVGADGRVVVQPLTDRIGTSGADRLVGDSGRDNLVGQGGDDILIGGDNWDTLNGGAGVDTGGYGGLIKGYTVAHAAGSFATVSGGVEGGTDNLASIERLSFLDGTLDLNPNGAAAQIYRLYDAALDRAPDQAGLSGWVGRLASGTTLDQAAQAFATSPEFTARYGAVNNEDFVKTMYRFSLNREGDASGISQWKAQLDSGVSRGGVLQSFSESVEHRSLTASAVDAGLFVQDDRTIAVARLYDAAFDRVPDAGGIAYWRGTLETGGSLFAIANAFVSSQEFQDRYGALNNTQFIDQLYRFTLDREADSFGRQVWVDRLDAGTTRAEMVVIFSESVEHVNLTALTWAGGVRYEGYAEPTSSSAFATNIHHDAFVLSGVPENGTAIDHPPQAEWNDQIISSDVKTQPAVAPALPHDVIGHVELAFDDMTAGHRHLDWI